MSRNKEITAINNLIRDLNEENSDYDISCQRRKGIFEIAAYPLNKDKKIISDFIKEISQKNIDFEIKSWPRENSFKVKIKMPSINEEDELKAIEEEDLESRTFKTEDLLTVQNSDIPEIFWSDSESDESRYSKTNDYDESEYSEKNHQQKSIGKKESDNTEQIENIGEDLSRERNGKFIATCKNMECYLCGTGDFKNMCDCQPFLPQIEILQLKKHFPEMEKKCQEIKGFKEKISVKCGLEMTILKLEYEVKNKDCACTPILQIATTEWSNRLKRLINKI